MTPNFETPWPKPAVADCFFYHTMRFPDGETIEGSWTIPDFADYIGGYDVNGKTVLDVGTASGYLAFAAEKAGARVTGLDAATPREFRHVPFADTLSYRDIAASRDSWTIGNLIPTRKAWWYGWHKNNSGARCVYAPIPDLYEWDTMFDVVIAGAIVEHLSDPVFAIGAWTKIATEAVIIPFTDVIDDETLLMRPMTPWTDSGFFYAWWRLSKGLYERVFDNLGFDVTYAVSHACFRDAPGGPREARRPTIIARRRGSRERVQSVDVPAPAAGREDGLIARLSRERDEILALTAELSAARADARDAETRAVIAEARLAEAEARGDALALRVAALESSTVWRASAPLRAIIDAFRDRSAGPRRSRLPFAPRSRKVR